MLDKIQSNKQSQFWIFFSVLVFLTLFMMLCNGASSSYSGYDFFFHFRRFHALTEALRLGTYPSYLDFGNVEGYGYFTNGFYPDVILLPFAVIALLTGAYFAYDFMIFSMTILCGVLMYHTIKAIYNSNYAAAIGALLYTFAIYRLYDIYQRGALAEALSFTFLPVVFLGLHYIVKGDYRKKWYVLVVGYSLLIYTHAIASVLMFITLLILLIISHKSLIKEPKRVAYLFLAGVVTLVIISFFLFPTIEQLNSNSFYLDSRRPGGGAGYGKVDFDMLFWGFVSGVAYPDRIWSGIGIVLVLIIALRFFIRGQKTDKLRSVDIAVIIALCFVFATCRLVPWGSFPLNLLGFIQYPWRLYEFSTFFLAVAGAYYLSLLMRSNQQKIVGLGIVVVAIMATTYIHSENFKTLFPKKTGNDPVASEAPSLYNHYHTIGGEYFPSKLPDVRDIHERGLMVETKEESTEILNLRRVENVTILGVKINKADTLILPLLYYHGYDVTLQGKKIAYFQNDYGLIAVPIDKSGEIQAYYAGTTIQRVSYYVSIVSVLMLIVYIIRLRKRNKNETTE